MNVEVTKESEEVIVSTNQGILGCVNGIVFYNYIYPYIFLILIQLILGASFVATVESNAYLIQMLLNLFTSILTLVVAIFIAKPKMLLNSLKLPRLDDFKTMIYTLIIMMAVTIGYNFLITALGVDIGSGNENQATIVEYIKNVPVLSFVTFVLVGPFLEEVTYRYFLFGSLKKFHSTLAIIVSGFIFMAVHGLAGFMQEDVSIVRELILLPPYMFSGCILACAYNKSGNLTTSTGTHMINNLISFILSAL